MLNQTFTFIKATKEQSKARLALISPSGAGKTWTALKIAQAWEGRTALIDTENGSAAKYAHLFDFDHLILRDYAPDNYIGAIHAAEQAGYDNLIIDSVSHAWIGKGGVLEIKDKATVQSRSKNSFTDGWREASPKHNALVDALVQCKCHLIVTMRAKTEYVLEKQNRDGREITIPRKVGIGAVQRDGLEYEFDIVGEMDTEHNLIITKSRCELLDNAVIAKPGAEFAGTVMTWLKDGAPVTPRYDRDARLRHLRELRQSESALLKARGETQTPIALQVITAMSNEEIESLIAQTESNVIDLKASK